MGANTVTLTVTDANGNTASATAIVTVEDKVAPTVITKNFTAQIDAGGIAVIRPADINNGSSDACGIASYSLSQTDFFCNHIGANTVTLTVIDVNGNSASATAIVTVEDKSLPTVITKNITIQLDATGNATITNRAVDNGSFDACGLALYKTDKTTFNCSNVGANTVTLTVTDANGNTASATAIVTVEDKVAPTVITKNFTAQIDAGGIAVIKPADINNGSSDACGIASYSLSQMNFFCRNIGANTVTLTVTDVNGNSASATAIVTVEDKSLPTVITKNITVQLDETGNVSITNRAVDAGSFDACGLILYTTDKTTFNCSNVGANTVTLTVKDANGNVASGTAIVTVEDKKAPVVLVKNITVQLGTDGKVTIAAADVDNGSTDNCGIETKKLTITNFTCANVGANTVTLTVKDVNGNEASANATVTVVDNIKPTVITQPVTIFLDAAGTASITAEEVDNGSTDNCSIATRTLNTSSFNCSKVGANTVTLTVKDVNGNEASATAIVTVVDKIAPTVICQSIAVFLTQAGTVTITPAQINNGSTDNCGIASYTLSQTVFNASGLYPVTLTVTDVNGNSNICGATVTVKKRPVTLVYTGDYSEQYSDEQTLSAILTDNLSGGTGISGKTINFSIGTQTVSAVTNASGVATATLIINQNPDAVAAYNVSTTFAGDGTYLAASDNDAFDITDEDARVNYTGLMFQATPTVSTTSATVQLMASVIDITAAVGDPAYDAFGGDIRNARVRFINRDNNTYLTGWLIPSLIGSDLKVGTVSAPVTFSIGSADAAQFTIGIEVGTPDGYYVRNSSDDNTVLTVYKPLGDFVAGGGYIVPTQSSGSYASTPGLKTNFGLNVKYNKSGTNLKGSVNIIFRRKVAGVIRTYQIKANAMTALGVGGTNTDRKAQFLSKANLTDVTNPLLPLSLGGNFDLRVDMTDRGETGNTDSIGVALFDGGTLLYSSNWVISKTVQRVLVGGNIKINGANFGAVRIDPYQPITSTIKPIISDARFDVKVMNNPTLTTFKLKLESSNISTMIAVKVIDMNGRIVEVKQNLTAGQIVELGVKYVQGSYFVEVTQGVERKVLKLIKAGRE